MAKVTIVIPLFNRKDLILETLNSIVDQTYTDFECIVIDDGSTDGSLEIVEKFITSDRRFFVSARSSVKKGACACRNEGIEKATGQYLMFLDSDDLLLETCLEQRVRKIEDNPRVNFIVNQIGTFYHKDYKVTHLWSSLRHADDLNAFIMSEGWQTSSTFFDTSFVRRYRFDEDALSYQDVDFHLRILLDQPTYVKFPDSVPDVFMRISSFNRISTSNISFDRIRSRIKLYTKLERLLEAGGFEAHRYPYLIYNFKFLEIAARLLPFERFIEIYNLWRLSPSYQHRRSPMLKKYLMVQALLRKWNLRILSAVLYRLVRLFIARKFLTAENRKVQLEKPILLKSPSLTN